MAGTLGHPRPPGSRQAKLRTSKLRGRLAAAWAALGWERIWRAAWPGVLIVGLFVAVALFDLLPALPGWLHMLILLACTLGLAYAVWRGLRAFHRPTAEEARRGLRAPQQRLRTSAAPGRLCARSASPGSPAHRSPEASPHSTSRQAEARGR